MNFAPGKTHRNSVRKSLITHCDGKNVGKQILSYIDGGSVTCPMEIKSAIPIKITKHITFDLAILLLGIYLIHGGSNIYLCADRE